MVQIIHPTCEASQVCRVAARGQKEGNGIAAARRGRPTAAACLHNKRGWVQEGEPPAQFWAGVPQGSTHPSIRQARTPQSFPGSPACANTTPRTPSEGGTLASVRGHRCSIRAAAPSADCSRFHFQTLVLSCALGHCFSSPSGMADEANSP
jgi:hypothetical protein